MTQPNPSHATASSIFTGSLDGRLRTVADYETYCREITPPSVYELMYGEPGDPEWSTYSNNRKAFDVAKLRPRVLAGAGDPSLATSLLDTPLHLPLVVGPTGLVGDLDPAAEVASVRAAGSMGALLVLSAASTASTAEVAAAATGPWWQQTFVYRDRALTAWQVEQAAELGAGAIVLTVSNAAGMWHRQHMRYPGVSASKPEPMRNLAGYPGKVPDYVEYKNLIDPAVGWADVDWVRSLSKLPLVVKGIQTAEDARLCVEHGVQGIVVSNHGGRYLQGARAALEALPEVVAAVDGRLEVSVDGGVRQGEHVLKALAVGARTVWIGRAARWAQAVGGYDGLRGVLQILRDELHGAMALCGVADATAVDPSLVTWAER